MGEDEQDLEFIPNLNVYRMFSRELFWLDGMIVASNSSSCYRDTSSGVMSMYVDA